LLKSCSPVLSCAPLLRRVAEVERKGEGGGAARTLNGGPRVRWIACESLVGDGVWMVMKRAPSPVPPAATPR